MLKWIKKLTSDPKKELQEILGEYEPPTFSAVATETLRKLRDPDAHLSEASDRIVEDPGLSVKLLRIANSAAYALRHPVRDVPHAVSLLGRSEVEALLLAAAVRDSLPSTPVDGFDPKRFWQTSARRAATARALAQNIQPSMQSESFTAALLQDMALPILAQQKPKEYGPLLQHAHETGDDIATLEESEFGWSHGFVAGLLCSTWDFPDTLTEAITDHHSPIVGPNGQTMPSATAPGASANAPDAPPKGPAPEAVESAAADVADTPFAVRLVSHLKELDEHNGVDELIETVNTTYGVPKDDIQELVDQSFAEADRFASSF